MEPITLIKISEHHKYIEMAANWFSQKWQIPQAAYLESMQECALQKTPIPQWYIIVNTKQEIIAGAGIIQNDFHERKDLSPNLCALFVEEPYRKQGIARYLLDFARRDMGKKGYPKLYLVTDHLTFYEKCDWHFLAMVQDNNGIPERMYVALTK